MMHDEKFVDSFVNKYSLQKNFENHYILISKKNCYGGKNEEKVQVIYPFSFKYFQLIDKADSFDFIIIYHLEYWKAFFINRIKKNNVIIIWSFFGAEIYNNPDYSFLKKLYSAKTMSLLKKDYFVIVKNLMRKFKYCVKNRKTPNKEIKFSFRKIDYFAWYSEEEYNLLKQEIVELPKFLKYNIDLHVPIYETEFKKTDTILLGNSRAPENNHIDILLLLEEMDFQGTIMIPFSYGSDFYYANSLKECIKSFKIKIVLLEDFLPFNSYVAKLSACNIAVYNSFRQMALGNILISLVNGMKVYLSENNISYSWLKNLGFQIFSIEKDLQNDLKQKNCDLQEREKFKNQALYTELTSEINHNKFMRRLQKLPFENDKMS